MDKGNIEHTDLLVLKLLSGEDMYGYQMITELERRSENVFRRKDADGGYCSTSTVSLTDASGGQLYFENTP